MLLSEYCNLSVQELSELIRRKEVGASEALDCAIARMHEINPLLNAIVTDCSAWARKQLKKMKGNELFYGVPILVKDLGFALEGVRYTAGSIFYTNSTSLNNSDFINRLLALGMVPFAKTNVPELGLSYVTESFLHGPCRNPYNLNCTSGGSSGGSAAAVAAGVAPLATANDGGGSIRIPAACCGLFGFKPTPGLAPVGPWAPEPWSGLSASHVLTRNVQDSALLFECLTAQSLTQAKNRIEVYKNTSSLPPLTIALLDVDALTKVPIAEAYTLGVKEAVKVLKECGHQVIPYKLSLDNEAIGECTLTMIAANTWAEIENQQSQWQRQAQQGDLESLTWEFVLRGQGITASQLINSKNKLYQLLQPLRDLFQKFDVILTPALAQLPIPIGSWRNSSFEDYLQKNMEFSPFTALFNQAEMPAMTMPVMHYDGFPISVQFAAGKGNDRLLLQLAKQLSAKLPDFSSPIMAITL
ncbi:amidase [Legionella brunensis]|uniref:Amidase n=1 Tax=Legionella brunensis TaxID=29422 RepID=A0A0W0S0J9_9GAMM|nr:amidase [Legionella brunensis]KTC76979.1 amidase [Legionella brunensis]